MFKKIFYSIIFCFVSLFIFSFNVKADYFNTVSAPSISCSSSTWPTFLEEENFYPCIFSGVKNWASTNVPTSTLNERTIDDMPYIVVLSSKSPVTNGFDYYVFYSPTIPEIVTYNNNASLKFNDGYLLYKRYYFAPGDRRTQYFYSDKLGLDSSNIWYYNINIFSNHNYDRIYSTNNFSLTNFNLIPNFLSTQYYTLPFAWGDIYHNYFYLDDVLVAQNSCSMETLNLSITGFPCEFSTSEPITANKVVSIVHLATTYLPSEYWYNLLNWSDTTDRYYNSLFGGFFPTNSNLISFDLYDTSSSSSVYTTNILDTQLSSISRPVTNLTYSLFSSAFTFNDSYLTGYNSLRVVLEFPESSFTNFSIWNEGFNNLSENYIQENIDIATHELQQEILNDLNGNTVSVDKYFMFFDDFDVNYHGLSSLITIPLSYLSNISSSSCSSLSFPLPFLSRNLVIPCFSSLYTTYLGSLYDVIQFIIRGIFYYLIVLDCFRFIKKLHSPNNDSVEVIDL